ncbi:MAG: hypothetical protein R3B47_08450 [Bacteroidia bacterium]
MARTHGLTFPVWPYFGGMWVANLYYWGFNSVVSSSVRWLPKASENRRKGSFWLLLSKTLIPLIVVVPGIVAYVMNAVTRRRADSRKTVDGSFSKTVDGGLRIVNDNASPWLIANFIPAGLKGLVLAALAAAIVSSLASMLNSTATIFTMDLYKPYIGKNASEKRLVNVGRLSAGAALVIAMFLAPMLQNLGQVFQYIQEYTGIVSPGILAVFMLGLFWKKTTNNAAIWGVLGSIPIALYFKVAPNGWSDSGFFVNLPFMDQMFWTWIITMAIMVVISYLENKGKDHEKGIVLEKGIFNTEPVFNISAVVICLILAALYAMFW